MIMQKLDVKFEKILHILYSLMLATNVKKMGSGLKGEEKCDLN